MKTFLCAFQSSNLVYTVEVIIIFVPRSSRLSSLSWKDIERLADMWHFTGGQQFLIHIRLMWLFIRLSGKYCDWIILFYQSKIIRLIISEREIDGLKHKTINNFARFTVCLYSSFFHDIFNKHNVLYRLNCQKPYCNTGFWSCPSTGKPGSARQHGIEFVNVLQGFNYVR